MIHSTADAHLIRRLASYYVGSGTVYIVHTTVQTPPSDEHRKKTSLWTEDVPSTSTSCVFVHLVSVRALMLCLNLLQTHFTGTSDLEMWFSRRKQIQSADSFTFATLSACKRIVRRVTGSGWRPMRTRRVL